MYELLLKTITDQVGSTEEERQRYKRSFIAKKLRKRQYLLQQGDVSNRLAFVEKGALYTYSHDDKGATHVIQFAFEGWWTGNLHSFLTKEPSKLQIEALEDCELLVLDLEQHQQLMKEVPPYESYTRMLYQNAYVALQARLEATLGLGGEEKYTRFLTRYPFIFNRVPQHLIASYLGVTPETLSRIRRQLTP